MQNSSKIITDLATILSAFQGREYSEPVHYDTLFFAELGFSSIDAVVLGETLEDYYGQKLPFNLFLAEAMKRNAEDIRVGELADFLVQHLQERNV